MEQDIKTFVQMSNSLRAVRINKGQTEKHNCLHPNLCSSGRLHHIKSKTQAERVTGAKG